MKLQRSTVRKLVMLAATAAVVSGVVALRAATAADTPPSPPPGPDTTTAYTVQQDPASVDAFWTEERMRKAIPD
ncbi:hypothetical protein [Streptomyces luteireticuli]|uniref:Uncharacterized protein n=1 Tax=Streptomyces luteireticuli TaxID=173858 RepID=A0ABN0YZT7_9ACTN